jgi:hypothetical protein
MPERKSAAMALFVHWDRRDMDQSDGVYLARVLAWALKLALKLALALALVTCSPLRESDGWAQVV